MEHLTGFWFQSSRCRYPRGAERYYQRLKPIAQWSSFLKRQGYFRHFGLKIKKSRISSPNMGRLVKPENEKGDWNYTQEIEDDGKKNIRKIMELYAAQNSRAFIEENITLLYGISKGRKRLGYSECGNSSVTLKYMVEGIIFQFWRKYVLENQRPPESDINKRRAATAINERSGIMTSVFGSWRWNWSGIWRTTFKAMPKMLTRFGLAMLYAQAIYNIKSVKQVRHID